MVAGGGGRERRQKSTSFRTDEIFDIFIVVMVIIQIAVNLVN